MSPFEIQALKSTHPRKEFACGVSILDRYLAELATQDIKRRVSNCFVALDGSGAIAGYYTFAASSIPLIDLAAAETKRLPRYPVIPAALIGRLAVDTRFKGRRLGSALVVDALRRCVRADAAIYAMLVDAKDDEAVRFYEHLGFRRFASRPKSLYMPVADAPSGSRA